MHTDPKLTEKAAQWPRPTSKKEVQQFLRLANYYRRFVQGFANIVKTMHRLTEKMAKFVWTCEFLLVAEGLALFELAQLSSHTWLQYISEVRGSTDQNPSCTLPMYIRTHTHSDTSLLQIALLHVL